MFLVTPILSQKFGRGVPPTERDEESKGKEEEKEEEEEGTSTVEITAAEHNPSCSDSQYHTFMIYHNIPMLQVITISQYQCVKIKQIVHMFSNQ